MGAHSRKLKFLTLRVGTSTAEDLGATQFQCQVENWRVVNNTADGDKRYTFCYDPAQTDAQNAADGEFREDAEPDYALELRLHADWRSGGLSWFLTEHDGETLWWRIDHHPNIPAEHIVCDGRMKVKAPTIGGDARATEMTEVTLPVIGKPDKRRGNGVLDS